DAEPDLLRPALGLLAGECPRGAGHRIAALRRLAHAEAPPPEPGQHARAVAAVGAARGRTRASDARRLAGHRAACPHVPLRSTGHTGDPSPDWPEAERVAFGAPLPRRDLSTPSRT